VHGLRLATQGHLRGVLLRTRPFPRLQMCCYGIPTARVHGRRDLKPTDCPGDRLYAWLGRFKAARPA
jgi:hypothetical protein